MTGCWGPSPPFPDSLDGWSGATLGWVCDILDGIQAGAALGRMPGWIAHWMEHHDDPHSRIGRPRQIYTGPGERDYVGIDKR